MINDDRVAPGRGFGTHSHGDMEIVTLVLEGSLAHKDNLGSVSILKPGDVQVMSAGSGITHSEYNGSEDEPVWFFQIWIDPDREGLEPSYAERSFPEEGQLGKLTLLAAREGAGGALPVHQDIRLFTAVLEPETPVEYALAPDRHAWLQVARGTVALNGQILNEGGRCRRERGGGPRNRPHRIRADSSLRPDLSASPGGHETRNGPRGPPPYRTSIRTTCL